MPLTFPVCRSSKSKVGCRFVNLKSYILYLVSGVLFVVCCLLSCCRVVVLCWPHTTNCEACKRFASSSKQNKIHSRQYHFTFTLKDTNQTNAELVSLAVVDYRLHDDSYTTTTTGSIDCRSQRVQQANKNNAFVATTKPNFKLKCVASAATKCACYCRRNEMSPANYFVGGFCV